MIKRLVVMSDLHLEFHALQLPPPDTYDLAILAGDIHTKGRSAAWASEHFVKPVILVAGNHEFYNSSVERTLKQLRMPVGKHVHFLEQQTRVMGNVRFIGATCWTDFTATGNQVGAMLNARSLMNDYRQIRVEPDFRRLSPVDTRGYAEQTRAWLREEIMKPFDGLTVVITHHPPLQQLVPEIEGRPHLGAAYGNEWREFLEMPIDLWVFGHTHEFVNKVVGGIRFISNPRGYPGEETGFDPDLRVLLDLC